MAKIDLEKDILSSVQVALHKAIIEALHGGYNSPVAKLCSEVVEDNKQQLKELVQEQFSFFLTDTSFKAELKESLNKRLAKVIIGRMGGAIEKRVNELNRDPTTRAKLTVAISSCMEDL